MNEMNNLNNSNELKLYNAITNLPDYLIDEAATDAENNKYTVRVSWYKWAGIAATLALIGFTAGMFAIFAPPTPPVAEQTSAVTTAKTTEPPKVTAPNPGFTWIVEPTLEGEIRYCDMCNGIEFARRTLNRRLASFP